MGKLMDDISVSELERMRAEGMTFAEMGKALGVSSALVQRYCPHEKRERKAGRGEEINQLYQSGLTQEEIAERLGICQTTVSYYIRKGKEKVRKVDFSERRKRLEAKYEPQQDTQNEQEQEPQDEAGQILNGFVLSQTVEIGMATRKYIIHRDKDGCTVTMQAEFGEVQLTVDDLKDIAAECQVVRSWVNNHPKLGLEVV